MASLASLAAAIGLGGATAGTGSALSAIGGIVGAVGTVASGIAAASSADFEAKQMEQKATEERAAAQRDAEAKRREGRLVMSRQQALAAASGAGAGSDAPTIVKLMTDTAGQAEYNAQVDIYGGESRSRGLLDSAKGRRASGQASLLGSVLGGFGQAASGLARAYG